MSATMLPVISQLHDAPDNRTRALILLTVPDAVLMKYREVFEAACRRAGFEAGFEFVQWRRASWSAVRRPDGRLKLEDEFDAVRAAFAAYAAGEPG